MGRLVWQTLGLSLGLQILPLGKSDTCHACCSMLMPGVLTWVCGLVVPHGYQQVPASPSVLSVWMVWYVGVTGTGKAHVVGAWRPTPPPPPPPPGSDEVMLWRMPTIRYNLRRYVQHWYCKNSASFVQTLTGWIAGREIWWNRVLTIHPRTSFISSVWYHTCVDSWLSLFTSMRCRLCHWGRRHNLRKKINGVGLVAAWLALPMIMIWTCWCIYQCCGGGRHKKRSRCAIIGCRGRHWGPRIGGRCANLQRQKGGSP